MKGDRLRVPADPAYLSALGLAAYAFARLEWDAVWCCERIEEKSIDTLADKTAGGVAKKLVALAASLPSSSEQRDLCEVAVDFKNLVQTRNALFHAKPGTAKDGEQRLFHRGDPWTPAMIDAAADAFTACSLRLNALLHGFLAVLAKADSVPIFANVPGK